MLDLDMAFDATSFVDTETGAVGCAPSAFDRLLSFEKSQMLSVLAGADASSGVPQNMKGYLSSRNLPSQTVLAQYALTDTLISAFLAGCNGGGGGGGGGGSGGSGGEGCVGSCDSHVGTLPSGVPPFDPALHRTAHAIMRLAIIVMADYAA